MVTFILSIHCFNYKDGNADCEDFELSYFLECTTKEKIGRRGTIATCEFDGKSQFNLKKTLILSILKVNRDF